MILAAGVGSRLRPITEHTPKVLVEVAGSTVLEHIARRLIRAGADRIIVNVHHLAEQIEQFGTAHWDLDAELVLSHEPERPLGTGGGLLRAAPLIRRDTPFFLHVGDVISEMDLEAFYAAHSGSGALASLAVHERETSRCLLFDRRGLYGRDHRDAGWSREVRRPEGETVRLAFAGVHVVSPHVFELFEERGAFDILDAYLRLSAEGERIAPFDVGGARWHEIGNPERLEEARRALR